MYTPLMKHTQDKTWHRPTQTSTVATSVSNHTVSHQQTMVSVQHLFVARIPVQKEVHLPLKVEGSSIEVLAQIELPLVRWDGDYSGSSSIFHVAPHHFATVNADLVYFHGAWVPVD